MFKIISPHSRNILEGKEMSYIYIFHLLIEFIL